MGVAAIVQFFVSLFGSVIWGGRIKSLLCIDINTKEHLYYVGHEILLFLYPEEYK